MATRRTRVLPVLILVALTACDPGWHYRVPGGREVRDNGLEYELAGPSQTTLRAYGHVFTGSLSTHLRITNDGSTPVVIRPDLVRMLNREGQPIERKHYQPVVRCADHEDEVATLPPGEFCLMSVDFQINPRDERLGTLTMIHEGVSRDGGVLPVRIKLEKR